MSQGVYTFECPSCTATLEVPIELVGITGPCPYCEAVITAPDPNAVAPVVDMPAWPPQVSYQEPLPHFPIDSPSSLGTATTAPATPVHPLPPWANETGGSRVGHEPDWQGQYAQSFQEPDHLELANALPPPEEVARTTPGQSAGLQSIPLPPDRSEPEVLTSTSLRHAAPKHNFGIKIGIAAALVGIFGGAYLYSVQKNRETVAPTTVDPAEAFLSTAPPAERKPKVVIQDVESATDPPKPEDSDPSPETAPPTPVVKITQPELPAPEPPAPAETMPPEPGTIATQPVEMKPPEVPPSEEVQTVVPRPKIVDEGQNSSTPPAVLDEPRRVLEQFLAAKNWKERLALSQVPERVKDLMEQYYKSHADGAISAEALDYLTTVKEEKRRYHVYQVSLPNRIAFPVSVEETAHGCRVDWECFVEFKDLLLPKFFEKYSEEPGVFRVVMRRCHYFGSDVPEDTELLCFSVEPPVEGYKNHIFIDPNDESLLKELGKAANWNTEANLTVSLRWKKVKNGHPYVTLDKILAHSWRADRPDDGVVNR